MATPSTTIKGIRPNINFITQCFGICCQIQESMKDKCLSLERPRDLHRCCFDSSLHLFMWLVALLPPPLALGKILTPSPLGKLFPFGGKLFPFGGEAISIWGGSYFHRNSFPPEVMEAISIGEITSNASCLWSALTHLAQNFPRV